jgi:predicted ATPase
LTQRFIIFIIITQLFKIHFLDERTLIVLDEPEVHLHPNWQLKYAEIITLLVKNNIKMDSLKLSIIGVSIMTLSLKYKSSCKLNLVKLFL